MADIRTIKIFLASSEELADERIRFGDFIRTLDDTYEQRGFRIKLIKWEDLPKGYDGRPTQETYNEYVRQCDLFVSLFYTKAGEFTLKEYNVAKQTQCELGKPTIYVFLRVLDKGEKEDKTLTDFKQNVLGTVKHYWTNYESSDALQLKFVMDLLKVENKRLEDLKVENGIVNWGNIPVARMDNLSFASGNKDYQRMSQRLQELPEEIADARQLSDDHPEVGRYRDKLQKLLNEQNALKKELADQQTLLLDTAIRIAQTQGDEITDSMRRATEAFEAGDVAKANEILDQAERQGDRMYEEYLNNKSLQQWRQSLHKTIDELLQQTSMVMADVTVPIEQRIQKTHDLYRKADERAANTLYDKEKYAKLLLDYAGFLYKYGKYKEAEKIYLRQIAHSEELYGNENADTATSYNNIGLVYISQGEYTKALEYYFKDMKICEKILGKEHPDTAQSYNNIGAVYYSQGDYAKALEYYFKALKICEKVLGKEHPDTATSYNNIGNVYYNQGDYAKALDYHFKALEIREKVLGKEHPDTANSYNNIGAVYHKQGDYDKALEYFFKALEINEKVLGKDHPDTATSYNNIGLVYDSQGDYDKALEYYFKALEIREKSLPKKHPYIATSYNNIGGVYDSLGDYTKALEYYFKALEIMMEVLGKEHPDTASSYNNIAVSLFYQEEYQKSLEYFTKALHIRERLLGDNHPQTLSTKESIDIVKAKLGEKKSLFGKLSAWLHK
jgi:tetratricopeptide (TPR) repeat protein